MHPPTGHHGLHERQRQGMTAGDQKNGKGLIQREPCSPRGFRHQEVEKTAGLDFAKKLNMSFTGLDGSYYRGRRTVANQALERFSKHVHVRLLTQLETASDDAAHDFTGAAPQ